MRVFATAVDDYTFRTLGGVALWLVIETPEFGQVMLRPTDIEAADKDVQNHGWALTVDDALFAFRRGVGPGPTAKQSEPAKHEA